MAYRRRSTILLTTALLSLLGVATARRVQAGDPALSMKASLEPTALAVGERGRLVVDLTIPESFHLWAFEPGPEGEGPGPQPLEIAFNGDSGLVFVGPWHGDLPVTLPDRGFGRDLARYEAAHVRLERWVRLERESSSPVLELRGQICSESVCLSQRLRETLILEPRAGAARTEVPELTGPAIPTREQALGTANRPGPSATLAPEPSTTPAARPGREGVLKFLLTAFLLGLGALATPCVFPAIPLTVSFFSKYSQESFGRGAKLAVVYATTMVATFTGAGILISILFGVTGVQRFAAHPIFNLVLGGTLVFFALNLLGLFEIGVPAFVLGFVNRLESRYGRSAIFASASATRGDGVRDYIIVAVAAVTATTVFFTCTVAFVGGVIVAAADGEWFWPTVGMLAFASAFALPFFFLALFPQAAMRLRGKTGDWLSATRVTLGFLELAAATKFLSNADLSWEKGWLTREVVLAFWIPLFALAGLYLLGKLRFGESSVEGGEGGEGRISVLRMLAATAVFGLSLHLAVGLFNGRSFGSWLDAWLPPLAYPGQTPSLARGEQSSSGDGPLDFVTDLKAARTVAAREGRLLFLNYTGFTCTNCRYMEGAVFPRPEVSTLLRDLVRVELYTDGQRPEHESNREDQIARFKTAALPFYSVECANGTVLGTFASSTNDAREFETFLRDAKSKAVRCAPSEVISSELVKASVGEGQKAEAAPSDVVRPLVLRAERLSDGTPRPVIVPGKWNLINFWATYCAPCVSELKAFLASKGLEFEGRGGRFVLVAVEDPEKLEVARKLMNELSVPSDSALRVPTDYGPDQVDPRLEFPGSLPFTALISPEGEVMWRHTQALSPDELDAKLSCFVGNGRGGARVAKKCSASRPR